MNFSVTIAAQKHQVVRVERDAWVCDILRIDVNDMMDGVAMSDDAALITSFAQPSD